MQQQSLLVRITSPQGDEDARGMYHQFVTYGHCDFELDDIPMGVLRNAEEDGTNYILTVEITNPLAIRYIRSLRPTTS
ncbi:MAG: hypothetical protein SA339_03850 [Methanomassiliicoccus sp.]|nr:hypothetical protein [Methanomassiliicoccus sp.]